MLNFNSIRAIYPEVESKVKKTPTQRFSTKKSRERQAIILQTVKNKSKTVIEIVSELGGSREQVRYDVRTMINRGELINKSTGKQPYFVIAA